MAYVESYELNGLNGASTALDLTMPPHVADDVLLVFITQDANTTITMNTAGWTQIGTQTNGGTGLTSSAFYMKAAGSAEVANITTTDGWCAFVFCIKDVDTTAQLDGTPSLVGSAAASQFNSASINTAVANSLVLYLVGLDGIAAAGHSNPGPAMFLRSFDNAGSTATTAACATSAWYYQRAAGPTPTPGWTCSASVARVALTVAFKNKSGGRIPAYIDDSNGVGTMLAVGHHFSALNGITFPASLALVNIGPGGSGKATVYDAAVATADYGLNPYSSALSSTPAATAATSASGFEIQFDATKDLSSGFVVGTVIASTPKIANYTHGSTKEGGSYLALADANNYFQSYQILASDASPNCEGRAVFSVQPSQTTTAYGTGGGGTMASAAVKKIEFLSNCPLATITLYVSEVHLAKTQIIAGGDTNYPVDSEGLAQAGSSFRVKMIQRFGAAGILAYVPIQIGGDDAVNFQINAGALLFPRASSIAKKELNYHGAANAIGISYAGKSGDVIKHTNSVVTSPSPYYWEIHSAATNAATWSFTGLTVVGATVTLRNVMTFSGITFSSCASIDATGCSLDGCTVSGVPLGNNTLTTSILTNIDNCVIDVSQVTAGNYWCSVADPTIFSGNAFTGGGGHAIRITTPGTYEFVGNTFTGFGADGSTGAAIFNDSAGTVILNISGGGSTPTVKTAGGSSTTVNNNKILQLTGLVTGSDIVILTAGTSTERVNVDQNAGTTYNFGYTYVASDSVDICVYKAAYVPFAVRAYLLPNANGSLPVAQILDRNYTP